MVRSQTNRVIARGHDPEGTRDCLHDYARSLALAGERTVKVSARPGQAARKATVAIAFAPVLLIPPHVKRGVYEKRPLKLWVVRVAEVKPPAGVEPLEWFLLTNRPVATLADATERVAWYNPAARTS